jgi:DNA-binding response OmpR family regulator
MGQKKMLIVDDPDVRLGLQVRLNASHYDVVCAGDGVTSISEAGLPAGDGFSVLERIEQTKLALIPIRTEPREQP